MEWFRQLQFIAAVPMPEAVVDAFGTTVNGMWASPDPAAERVAEAHAKGRRVLFSVPLIALTPAVYEDPRHEHLLDEVCADVDGEPSEVDWYYWEAKPVYAACIYSERFRRYLLDRCRIGIEHGMDAVNLDEINTSIGLMDRDPGGCGFCPACLARFRRHAGDLDGAGVAGLDDVALRERLRRDDRLYAQYRAFHQREAHAVALELIGDVRALAADLSSRLAVTANLAYLGNHVPRSGVLWGPMWGPALDFAMLENSYQLAEGEPHLLLPRGKFGAWYRLASALTDGAPSWICPSILVPKQLAGERRQAYYELMFAEAYANGGRWGYYWWPGVDHETRMAATAPDALRRHIAFLREHRPLLEQARGDNALAVLYLDGSIGARPETHVKYLALAQALAEGGYQFDVRYAGDGVYADDAVGDLEGYDAVLIPEAGAVTPAQAVALAAYARGGGEIVTFSATNLDPDLVRDRSGDVLERFWREYRDADREAILESVAAYPGSRVVVSDRRVAAIRSLRGDELVLHLVNYRYDEATDTVAEAHDVEVSVSWRSGRPASCRLLALDDDRELDHRVEGGTLVIAVPRVAVHALVVAGPT